MILLNFAHPLTPNQIAAVKTMSDDAEVEVRDVFTHLDLVRPLGPQVVALADACDLTSSEWQTASIVVNPPSLGLIAMTLLAELHGRMGYFVPVLQVHPVPGIGRRYEVAGILNLQEMRDAARARRAH